MTTALRLTALQVAAGMGLPQELTLKAARAYLAFLENKEPLPLSFSLDSAWMPASREAIAGIKKKQAAAKKPPAARRKA